MRSVLAAALALGACGVDARYAGTAYRCDDGHACPPGQACVEGVCGGQGTPVADGGDDPAAPSSYAAEVLADEPILYLRFDELSGTTPRDSAPGESYALYADRATLTEPDAFSGSETSEHISRPGISLSSCTTMKRCAWTATFLIQLGSRSTKNQPTPRGPPKVGHQGQRLPLFLKYPKNPRPQMPRI